MSREGLVTNSVPGTFRFSRDSHCSARSAESNSKMAPFIHPTSRPCSRGLAAHLTIIRSERVPASRSANPASFPITSNHQNFPVTRSSGSREVFPSRLLIGFDLDMFWRLPYSTAGTSPALGLTSGGWGFEAPTGPIDGAGCARVPTYGPPGGPRSRSPGVPGGNTIPLEGGVGPATLRIAVTRFRDEKEGCIQYVS